MNYNKYIKEKSDELKKVQPFNDKWRKQIITDIIEDVKKACATEICTKLEDGGILTAGYMDEIREDLKETILGLDYIGG